ncbi:MAG: putative dsRNA-binding protein, partial [Pseudomonadota bacterium]
ARLHPKTALQEWAQSQGILLPVYQIIQQSGPDHAPLFDVQLSVEGYEPLTVQGRSRQEAEKIAAKQFLKSLG